MNDSIVLFALLFKPCFVFLPFHLLLCLHKNLQKITDPYCKQKLHVYIYIYTVMMMCSSGED